MKTADDILSEMAATFRERNAVYKNNFEKVGPVMMALFPEGIHLRSAEQVNIWHLFELIIVKITRFGNSALTHQESIHDIAVYAALIEAALHNRKDGDAG